MEQGAGMGGAVNEDDVTGLLTGIMVGPVNVGAILEGGHPIGGPGIGPTKGTIMP